MESLMKCFSKCTDPQKKQTKRAQPPLQPNPNPNQQPSYNPNPYHAHNPHPQQKNPLFNTSLTTAIQNSARNDDDVVHNEVGWAQEKPINDQRGETKFVEQVGSAVLLKNVVGVGLGGIGQYPQYTQQQQNRGEELWTTVGNYVGNQNVNVNQQGYQQGYQQQQQQGYGYQQQNNNNYQPQNNNNYQQQSIYQIAPLINKILYKSNPIFQDKQASQPFPSPFIKYKIIPSYDEKKSLDITSVDDKKRSLVKHSLIIWDFHGGPNQLFYIKEQKNKQYLVVNVARGFVLKVSEDANNGNGIVYEAPRNKSDRELWTIQAVGSGGYQYEIVSLKTGLVLGLRDDKVGNGVAVELGQRSGRRGQKWRIVPS